MFGIKIIKEKKLNQMLATIERQHSEYMDLQGQLENLHRLHQGLWKKYSMSENKVAELNKQLRHNENQLQKLNKKLAKR